MPSWSVHLALANKLNKDLKLGDDFILGNVLPDVLQGHVIKNPSQMVAKEITHFQINDEIDLESFIKEYKNNFDNPLVCGYLSHLMADKFFNTYFHRNHTIFKNGRKRTILKDGSLDNSPDKPWQIKQRDFKLFGQKFINNDEIPNLKKENINKNNFIIKENLITDEDLDKAIERVQKIKNSKKNYSFNNYEIFSEQKLNFVFNECYKKILTTLKSLN